jgi:FMN phosphatase YigB (HAD superfamily)
MTLTTIGFDADDTLWHHETYFRLTQGHFARLLAGYADPDHLHERLLEAERRNLGHYGFGVKGFDEKASALFGVGQRVVHGLLRRKTLLGGERVDVHGTGTSALVIPS